MIDDRDESNWLHRRLLLRAAFAAIPALLPRDVRAESAQRAGSVEFVKGEAFAEATTARRALDRDAPVFLGDRCAAGFDSRLTLGLGNNTRLKLGQMTRVTVDRYLVGAGGELTLEGGAMLFDRPEGAKPAPVQIRSSFALIAVRGTRFFAGPSNDAFGVFVDRGTVTVTAAGQRVVLQKGQGTDIRAPGEPPTAPKAWGPPRIAAALASVS